MEPLFKTTAKFTLAEYKKFNTAIMKRNSTLIIIVLFFIVFFSLAYIENNIYIALFAILYIPILYWIKNININKTYKSNKVMKDAEIEYAFFDDYFTVKHQSGESQFEYKMLNKVIETKTNLYLMIAKNQGYMLIKENFPEGLLEFLKNKQKEIK